MVADEKGDEYEETAIGYAIGVLTYMQNGGKLSSIEATASEIVRLAGRELAQKMPGPEKARVLMESVEEMRLRHNNLNADAVFEDMMAQARNAGRLRNEGK
jgi:hypothetical protein